MIVRFCQAYISLMEIKGFSQCIAANKQQGCGSASCSMAAACEFFVCKLVLLLLVEATLRLLVAATLRLLVAATLRLFVCCNLAAHCLLQPCGLCVFRMEIRFLALSCSLCAANSCSLFVANSCGLFAANSCY